MRQLIAVRLVVAVGLTLAVGLGIGAWVAVRSLEQQVIGEVQGGGIRLSDTVKRSLRYAMLHDDREGVKTTVRTLAGGQDVTGLRIFNKDGVVQFASDPAVTGSRVPTTDDACKGCHGNGAPVASMDPAQRTFIYRDAQGRRLFTLIEPLYNEPDCSSAPCHVHPADQKILGVMDLTLSLAPFDVELEKFRAASLASALVLTILIALVIFGFVHRFVTRRIRVLLKGMASVSGGNLDQPIRTSGDDEFAHVAQEFNSMTRSLSEARGHLLHSEKLAVVGRLAAGVAHEINNPLTGLMLISSNMLDSSDPSDPRRADLETISREAQRCREIVKGLLDFSRQTMPQRIPARIEGVIGKVLQVVRTQASKSGIQILEVGGDLPEIEMDAAQIQQVFLNLLVNAMDAMPDGGEITITRRLVDDGNAVEIDVADAGTGMPSDELHRIFEPFYTTKEGKGTGLGLSISWGIAEGHGGKLSARSQPGSGSTFTLRLPVKAAVQGSAAGT
jgi:two-component system NtrC family sensor kinase